MPTLPRRRKPQAVAATPSAVRERCSYGGIDWWYVERPGDEEMRWLREDFDFHELNLEDVLSRHQRPKLDEREDHLFIILHVPVWNRDLGRLETGEVDVFVTQTSIITLSSVRVSALREMFDATVADDEDHAALMGEGMGRVLYRVVDRLFDRLFPMLSHIEAKLAGLERRVFDEADGDVLRELTALKTETSTFRRAVRPQRVVIRDLERAKTVFGDDPDIDYYFDDIDDAAARVWDLLEGYLETINTLLEAHEAVTNQRVNEVLRILTAISVIVLPLTLLASVWGMNVHVPGEGGLTAFWAVIGAMAVLLVGMLAWFRREDWL